MNCPGFEVALPDLLSSDSSLTLQEAARRHRRECSDCQKLWDLVTSQPELPDPVLTRNILRRTSGAACRQVRNLLAQSLPLDPLASHHLDECAPCRQWILGKLWLQPGSQRASATSVSGKRVRCRIFEGLLRRPHFGLEAAYAGTILFFLLLGGSAGVLSWVQESGPRLTELVVYPVSAQFVSRGELVVEAISDFSTHLSLGLEAGGREAQEVRHRLEQEWKAARSTLSPLPALAWSKLLDLLRPKDPSLHKD